MIDRIEILRHASELGLEPCVVEKDYALGWLLAGISNDPVLAGAWIFKGSTCLKKCFLETCRSSGDLEFAITDAAQLSAAFLETRFLEIGDWIYEATGLELPADQRRFDMYDNWGGGKSCQVRIGYRGPIAMRGGDLPQVKLYLTADNILVLPPIKRAVTHAYSDAPKEGTTAHCYAFEELFAEKILALSERARPRDLHDVISLFRNSESSAFAEVVRNLVRQKCAIQNLGFPSLEALGTFRDELFAEWATHQLVPLPPVEPFWEALPEFFGWLTGTIIPATVARDHPLAAHDAGPDILTEAIMEPLIELPPTGSSTVLPACCSRERAVYVYICPLCGSSIDRDRNDSSLLGAHTSPSGWYCLALYGYLKTDDCLDGP